MSAFPQLSNADIDNIIAYTSRARSCPVGGAAPGPAADNGTISNMLYLVMLVLVVMLFLVNNVLSVAANGIEVV
jgi:hypothetical protein